MTEDGTSASGNDFAVQGLGFTHFLKDVLHVVHDGVIVSVGHGPATGISGIYINNTQTEYILVVVESESIVDDDIHLIVLSGIIRNNCIKLLYFEVRLTKKN